jgi:hypothetical protein
LIITRLPLPLPDAKSLLMKNRHKGEHGHLMASPVIPWDLQCTIIGAKMCISYQQPVSALLTHWNFSSQLSHAATFIR